MTLSERNIIEHIRKIAGRPSVQGLIRGIGDDCSVFGGPGPWLVSTDMLVDGVHFNRDWHPPRLLGRKSLAVNLSDIAAMGGIPRYILLSVSLPPGLSSEWLFQWLGGVAEILSEYDCALIGGDTVTGSELNISVTVLGEQHPAGSLYRSGAGAGDTVYVSGVLGSSAAGLAILKHMEHNAEQGLKDTWQTLVDAHLDPVPQIQTGQILCASGWVTSMQDISDGLATDLSHICKESAVSALILAEKLPNHPVLDDVCEALNIRKLDCILRGGEDYQLVFTVRKGGEKTVEDLLQGQGKTAYPIGTIEKGRGLFLEKSPGIRQEITFQGYEHLA
ncbi:MAG: thiamine-phosphate kinase [Desulfocapsaceae bacterium]|nr:thiamine-phosphate kinase [Desulfocapsaceae bacterium]